METGGEELDGWSRCESDGDESAEGLELERPDGHGRIFFLNVKLIIIMT